MTAAATLARSGTLPPAAATVTVWLDQSIVVTTLERLIVLDSRHQATEMFAAIGVALKWRDGPPHTAPDGPGNVIMHLDSRTPERLSGRALGNATFGGTACPVIRLLYTRILNNRVPRLQVALLAHAMVHEITHVLQGVARHSAEGVMKAEWDKADYHAMLFHPLPFTPEDITLVRTNIGKTSTGRIELAE